MTSFYSISGIESFEGRRFHSWEYRSAEGMQGKRVLVVGIGNSGGDIAVDISRVAEKVTNHCCVDLIKQCCFNDIVLYYGWMDRQT